MLAEAFDHHFSPDDIDRSPDALKKRTRALADFTISCKAYTEKLPAGPIRENFYRNMAYEIKVIGGRTCETFDTDLIELTTYLLQNHEPSNEEVFCPTFGQNNYEQRRHPLGSIVCDLRHTARRYSDQAIRELLTSYRRYPQLGIALYEILKHSYYLDERYESGVGQCIQDIGDACLPPEIAVKTISRVYNIQYRASYSGRVYMANIARWHKKFPELINPNLFWLEVDRYGYVLASQEPEILNWVDAWGEYLQSRSAQMTPSRARELFEYGCISATSKPVAEIIKAMDVLLDQTTQSKCDAAGVDQALSLFTHSYVELFVRKTAPDNQGSIPEHSAHHRVLGVIAAHPLRNTLYRAYRVLLSIGIASGDDITTVFSLPPDDILGKPKELVTDNNAVPDKLEPTAMVTLGARYLVFRELVVVGKMSAGEALATTLPDTKHFATLEKRFPQLAAMSPIDGDDPLADVASVLIEKAGLPVFTTALICNGVKSQTSRTDCKKLATASGVTDIACQLIEAYTEGKDPISITDLNRTITENLRVHALLTGITNRNRVLLHRLIQAQGTRPNAINIQKTLREIRLEREKKAGRLPVGAKLHVFKELSPDIIRILQKKFNIDSTHFSLHNANKTLVIPPGCPIDIKLLLTYLKLEGIIDDNDYDLQITISGRWPEEIARTVGTAMIFGSEFCPDLKPGAFMTKSHNDETGGRVMLYDAGGKIGDLPYDMPRAIGRTDMQGRRHLGDLDLYQVIGTGATHYVYHGRWHNSFAHFRKRVDAIIAESELTDTIRSSTWIYDEHQGDRNWKSGVAKHEAMLTTLGGEYAKATKLADLGIIGKMRDAIGRLEHAMATTRTAIIREDRAAFARLIQL
ncbi:MAG: hypothetical protein HY817_02125 [Candidatus Abawacabacteria bacterium]|nr:hypothetical protein [Candidatus Abawacabacteria bacterium]